MEDVMRSEDIAKIAGVSRSTVSRVINNYTNVPEETRQKVMKVIEQYQYEPNTYARALAGKSTNTIGLFIISTSDKDNPNRIYQNNYFGPFVDVVIDRANASGYYVLIHTIYANQDAYKIKQAFLQKRIDGAIVVGTQEDMRMLPELIASGYPICLMDYDPKLIPEQDLDHGNVAIINSMDFDGALEAVRFLLDHGHREIGIITGNMKTFSGQERLRAYEYALKERGLPISKGRVLKGKFLKSVAQKEILKLLQKGTLPTALFISNDDMAIGVMDILHKHQVQVPEDISIVGYDDIPVGAQLKPSLTTVHVPVYEMACKAVEILMDRIEGKRHSDPTYQFPCRLVIRQTT